MLLNTLLEPFQYSFMLKAIWVSTLVGVSCAFLSVYLMLRGWSLMGDALSHSIVPGVAIAYIVGFPYALGAFLTGILAALGISIVHSITRLREDAIIGLVFSTFFAIGLLVVSLKPISVSVQEIVLGNILGIDPQDVVQVAIISIISLIILSIKWKDLLLIFFDEIHAFSLGIPVFWWKIIFFTLLSACTVAALKTVGAILVISMVITPGATAYLITDKFSKLLLIAICIGGISSALGSYISYFLNGATGAVIVTLQTLIFFIVFVTAPKYGLIAKYMKNKSSIDEEI